jgi:carbamoyl-phosphate synthase large subunit
LSSQGIDATVVNKVSEGRPHIVDYIKNGDIQMVINTSVGRKSSRDAYHIRRGALTYNILYTTTLAGARALSEATKAMISEDWQVCSLQEYYKK